MHCACAPVRRRASHRTRAPRSSLPNAGRLALRAEPLRRDGRCRRSDRAVLRIRVARALVVYAC
eukprot:7224582-Alexandrium_andersonii.AAC.1